MDFGTLHLPLSPGEIPPALWADVSMNRILTVLMVAVSLLALRDYFQLYPLLAGCMVRSRGNLEIEHSVSQARNRNRCALAGLGILSLLADRYSLYPAAFLGGIPPQWRVMAMFGVLGAYTILHRLLASLLKKRKLDSESRAATAHALYNYFLALLPLMLLSVAVLWIFRVQDAAVRTVLLAETAAVLLLTLVREGQILSSKYSPLQTFLYLCGFELLPFGVLIILL